MLPPTPLPATVAHGALPMGERGAFDVRTVVMVDKAGALAAMPLRAGAYPYLVPVAGLSPRRDKPFAAQILKLIGIKLEETMPAKYVSGDGFSGGLVPRMG